MASAPGARAASGHVPLPPAGKAYFGAYSPPSSSWTRDAQRRAYLDLEQQLGRKLDIAQLYYGWGGAFPGWWERWQVNEGRIPLITWAGHDTAAIANGSEDGWIAARADAVRKFGSPVFIRWGSEMDGSGETWVRSATSFVDAWQRIHSIFARHGATNATFVWCPTAWGFNSGAATAYYPGDSQVDWVCSDGYNWAPGRTGAIWRSFKWIFSPFYHFGVAHGKPMIIAEYGCQEGSPRAKARWFDGARAALKSAFPKIRAVSYFDSFTLYDWRLRTSNSSFRRFRRMSLDDHFKT